MKLTNDILIVGNGVIGKVAALGCAQMGLSVTLLSPPGAVFAAPQAGWDIRVYALNHTARSLLASIKVWDALDTARIAAVESMSIHSNGGRIEGHLLFDAYSARVGTLAWIVEDSNLYSALDSALKFAHVRQVMGQ